jgi:hypothetical protein
LARRTGPLTCGFGRYGIVAPFGGDCSREKTVENVLKNLSKNIHCVH